MKTCKDCGVEKPLSEFYKHPGMKDGRLNSCKVCKVAASRSQSRREGYHKEYYQANKHNWAGYGSVEKKRASSRAWKKNNPDKVAEGNRKRRAMKLMVNENFTSADERTVRQLFSNKCLCCGATENLAIDHMYPLSKGHALELDNAVLLCGSCNSSKRDKLPEEFFTEKQLSDIIHIHRWVF